jgi:Activator of Hsp90 ATPase homolog 1-like protein
VRREDHDDTSIEDLWSALTEPDRLARRIAAAKGELRPGGTFHARFTSGWEGPGRVEVREAPRRLLPAMNPGLPLARYARHGAGWQAHVEDLAAHLAGRERADWHRRWTELCPAYRNLV